MTLILGAELGGIAVAMTSDTRQVLAFGNKESVSYLPFLDAKSKVERISPYCIFGGGGTNHVVNPIKEQLKGKATFIEDFKEPLERIIAELSAEFKNDETAAQIMISGFNEDGSTGVLTFNTGEGNSVDYRKHEFGKQDMHAIAPSADELGAILKAVKFPEVSDVMEFPPAVLSYLASIQAASFENDPKTVSETCNYCVLFRNPFTGEFACFEDSVKVSE